MEKIAGLVFHHVGIAVENIEVSITHYEQVFGKKAISNKIYISSQNVNVCFIQVGESTFLELVEPANENSSIHRMLKKGFSYYHMAYLTNEIEKAVEQLISLNYKEHSYFNSEAFGGKRCIFLFSPEGSLIELIEK